MNIYENLTSTDIAKLSQFEYVLSLTLREALLPVLVTQKQRCL